MKESLNDPKVQNNYDCHPAEILHSFQMQPIFLQGTVTILLPAWQAVLRKSNSHFQLSAAFVSLLSLDFRWIYEYIRSVVVTAEFAEWEN